MEPVHSEKKPLTALDFGGALTWLLSSCALYGALVWYASTPGASGVSPRTALAAGEAARGELKVFLHPLCPCSRATLSELERLMPSIRDKAEVSLIFVQLPGRQLASEGSALWERARKIPGVKLQLDKDVAEAARFGARTSGHAVLYDAQGRLAFSGGLTAARGHEGDSPGRAAILEWAEQGDQPAFGLAPTYGCSLKKKGGA